VSRLLVFLPGAVTHAIALRQPRLHIGRYRHNAVVLPDAHVSGVHAVLQRTDSGWWIEDLGSTNVTWINGKRTQVALLLPDDVLRIGPCTLRLLPSADKAMQQEQVARPRSDALVESLALPADFGQTDLMRSSV
jgi:pSer/pThr/pTyr-binding forkhead associated (FHA) protein